MIVMSTRKVSERHVNRDRSRERDSRSFGQGEMAERDAVSVTTQREVNCLDLIDKLIKGC